MEVIGGIITYNPNIQRLKQNIEACQKQIERLIIIDNGSNNIDQIAYLCNMSKRIELICNNQNLGIAKALNQIFEFASSENAQWVLTLDQDTIIPENTMFEYMPYTKIDEIGVICPVIFDNVAKRRWPRISQNEYKYVDRCITSASLNRMNAWKTVRGFDEYLFIDEVDHDFCYRIAQSGYRIVLVGNVTINHQIGNTDVKKLLGMPIYIRNHSAFRKYYIVRNMLCISRKHTGKIQCRAMLHAILFICKTTVFEKDRIPKLKACFRGFVDGVKGK